MDGAGIGECEIFEVLSFVFDKFAIEIDACDAVDVADNGTDVAVEDFFVVVVSELHDAVSGAESLEAFFKRCSVWVEVGL